MVVGCELQAMGDRVGGHASHERPPWVNACAFENHLSMPMLFMNAPPPGGLHMRMLSVNATNRVDAPMGDCMRMCSCMGTWVRMHS
jgi:hypothetical protein